MIGAIVHARMSSRRLPGKVLTTIAGRPLLVYLSERLEKAHRIDRVVIATSTAPDDDPIAEFARDRGLACHRGPLDDVAGRVIEAADAYDIDIIVRISGDSPMLDQRLIDHAVDLFAAHDHDLVTNVHPRTFPTGQSVEVFRTTTLRDAREQMTTPVHLEHVTSYFYDHADVFDIHNFEHEPSLAGRRMTVDEPDDVAAVSRVLEALSRPHWDYSLDELIDVWDA